MHPPPQFRLQRHKLRLQPITPGLGREADQPPEQELATPLRPAPHGTRRPARGRCDYWSANCGVMRQQARNQMKPDAPRSPRPPSQTTPEPKIGGVISGIACPISHPKAAALPPPNRPTHFDVVGTPPPSLTTQRAPGDTGAMGELAAMQPMRNLRRVAAPDSTVGSDVVSPVRQPHRGRRVMRQMLIAAAIAAGLVALWAALLPIAA